jgi:hypothetical protein
MPLSLRPGIDLDAGSVSLGGLLIDAENVTSGGTGGRWTDYQQSYLIWVDVAESRLRNLFLDTQTWSLLYTDRYWHIRSVTSERPRSFDLIRRELEHQTERIRELQNRLDRFGSRLAQAGGRIAVLDTNVLLHYQPVDSIPWLQVVGVDEIRLVLPLRVIEELDAKKYTSNPRLSSRARSLLPRLWKWLRPTAGAPTQLAPGITIEVPILEEPRYRPGDADQEILDTCREFRAAGADALLVTGDTAL